MVRPRKYLAGALSAALSIACGGPSEGGSAGGSNGFPSSGDPTTGSSGEGSGEGGTSSSSSSSGASGAASSGGGEGCGQTVNLEITSPGASAVNPVLVTAVADGPIARVVYEAEAVTYMGESTDVGADFAIEYTFAPAGPRSIHATAYDACGYIVGGATRVTVVSDGEDTGETGDTGVLGDDVCYPGPGGAWDVCFPLVIPMPAELGFEYPPPLDMDPQFRAPQAFIDLTGVDLAIKVAPNFALSELVTAKFGPFVVVQPSAVAHIQGLRDALGPIQVPSGFRNPTHNASLGGSTWSRHIYGDTFDLYASNASLGELYDRCGVEGAAFREVYDDHVHCDWRGEPVDERFFGPAAAPAPDEPPRYAASLVPDGDGWAAPAEGWDEGEPLRRWRALDAEGAVIASGVGVRFTPPAEASALEVTIGEVLVERVALD